MLHILLLILKILGIIIAAILGILVLFICIVLFVPIRYEISAKCDGTLESLKAKIKATWLLHIIRADIMYAKKVLKWRARIAWIIRKNTEAKVEVNENEISKIKEAQTVETVEEPEKKLEKDKGIIEEIVSEKEPETITEKPKKVSDSSEKKVKKDKEGLFQKIKLKYKEFCEKIKELKMKKDKLTELITDPVHVDAFQKCLKELKNLLKRLKPKKALVKVRYGFEDLYITGQVLAVLGMLYPFVGESTEIVPDFENKILKGTIYIKGKIRVIHIVALLWNLFWSKNVRTTYKDIKSFKL